MLCSRINASGQVLAARHLLLSREQPNISHSSQILVSGGFKAIQCSPCSPCFLMLPHDSRALCVMAACCDMESKALSGLSYFHMVCGRVAYHPSFRATIPTYSSSDRYAARRGSFEFRIKKHKKEPTLLCSFDRFIFVAPNPNK